MEAKALTFAAFRHSDDKGRSVGLPQVPRTSPDLWDIEVFMRAEHSWSICFRLILGMWILASSYSRFARLTS